MHCAPNSYQHFILCSFSSTMELQSLKDFHVCILIRPLLSPTCMVAALCKASLSASANAMTLTLGKSFANSTIGHSQAHCNCMRSMILLKYSLEFLPCLVFFPFMHISTQTKCMNHEKIGRTQWVFSSSSLVSHLVPRRCFPPALDV